MNSPRRRAREAALKALYQAEIAKIESSEALYQVLSETVYSPIIEAVAKDYLKNSKAQEVISGKVEDFLPDFTDSLSSYPHESSEELAVKVKFLLEKHFPGVTYNREVSEETQKLCSKIGAKFLKLSGTEEFAKQLVDSVSSNISNLDLTIDKTAKNWTLDRIASVDKCILRLSICEFFYFPEIPVNVTINEAIELAKKYSDERSHEFINGILDKVSKENTLNKTERCRNGGSNEIVSAGV
ncbi:MAG: transcription antitermination factor NusB [Candidatus Riflebacteria bacterium]|nr:transcription antitermination factor NusB [Candidatus Riflebacteria bacterium]